MHRRQQRQRQRQHYRDRYEILRNILFIVANTQPLYRNYMNKMRLAYVVGLTHSQMVEYLGQLLNCGLLIRWNSSLSILIMKLVKGDADVYSYLTNWKVI